MTAGGRAARAGLEPGMVIASVDREQVTSVADLVAILSARSGDATSVLLLVRTAAGSRFMVVKP